MPEPSDFISSYRCALADFDLDLYKGESPQARAYRKVDVLFGVLFILVGFIFALIFMKHTVPLVVGVSFIIYGSVLITIRTCSFWRPEVFLKPDTGKMMDQTPTRVRPCYETFAKKRGARPKVSN